MQLLTNGHWIPHVRVREDSTEAKDSSLVELADTLFISQYLQRLYLAQTMLQTESEFPIDSMFHQLHLSYLAMLVSLYLFLVPQCFYCFQDNDWHCLKKSCGRYLGLWALLIRDFIKSSTKEDDVSISWYCLSWLPRPASLPCLPVQECIPQPFFCQLHPYLVWHYWSNLCSVWGPFLSCAPFWGFPEQMC